VFAWYHKANNTLLRSLKGRVKELHAVGDCVAPRKAIDAIREGFLLGRAL
jgi:2,4-dienoyl-CoA reductase (NADPH2)